MRSPLRLVIRLPPAINSPTDLARRARSQTCGRPSRQRRQRPQDAENWNTTWSPTRTSSMAAPTSTTSPDPSCPSAIGTGRGRSPLIMDKSEWQSPAPAMRTSNSTGLGGARFTSSMDNGFDCAYGRGAPTVLSTAALHRIVMADPVIVAGLLEKQEDRRRKLTWIVYRFVAMGSNEHISGRDTRRVAHGAFDAPQRGVSLRRCGRGAPRSRLS